MCMIKFYTKEGCTKCAEVIGALQAKRLAFELLDIGRNNNFEELIKVGGKDAPFFVDFTCAFISSDEKEILSHIATHANIDTH